MQPYTVGKLISYINRNTQKELADMLKEHGIGGGGHYSYLKAILVSPGLNQDQLTSEVKLDKATTARCVRQLEDAGYVTRTVDESDRRSYRLYPTPKAKDFEPMLQAIIEKLGRSLTASLTEAEKNTLHELLQKVYDHQES